MEVNTNHAPPTSSADVLVAMAKTLTRPDREQHNWVTAYLELFGPGSAFMEFLASQPLPSALAELCESRCVQECLARVAELRKRNRPKIDPVSAEAVQVITVRLPKRVHASLRQEARALNTSLNKLCVSKLLSTPRPETIISDK